VQPAAQSADVAAAAAAAAAQGVNPTAYVSNWYYQFQVEI
jgi:hypothetical protein